ncbi:MAG: hypothetical protein IH840_08730 [Candidatus Heimdallarchaeota archaeon]|nr:hypothetical protein [Candidatus Heimdallarchaeota archaeon]
MPILFLISLYTPKSIAVNPPRMPNVETPTNPVTIKGAPQQAPATVAKRIELFFEGSIFGFSFNDRFGFSTFALFH